MKKKQNREQIAAARGARWLDKHHPNWFEKITLDTLDMAEANQCVLGQCFGDFYEALNVCGRPNPYGDDDHWPVTYGFSADNSGGSWERLAFAWAPLIAERQVRARIAGT